MPFIRIESAYTFSTIANSITGNLMSKQRCKVKIKLKLEEQVKRFECVCVLHQITVIFDCGAGSYLRDDFIF